MSWLSQIRGLDQTNENLLLKCIEVLKHFHIRYRDTSRVLNSLFALSIHASKDVSSKALEAIKETVAYNHSFIICYKNLYPQITALKYSRKVPSKDKRKFVDAIATIMGEILSSEIEGSEWSSADTLTYHSGSMVPNDVLKKLRKDTIDFTVEIYKDIPDTKEKIILIKALLRALETPFNVAYGEDLIEMIQEDSKMLAKILSTLLYPTATVSNYLVAQEIDESLINLLRNDSFKNAEIIELYERLQNDIQYTHFSILVGNIQEFRNLNEDWHVAEERRIKEINELITTVSKGSFEEWYKTLNEFAEPIKEGLVEEWKYNSYRLFVSQFTASESSVATTFFIKAVSEDAPLGIDVFITPYLATLRRIGDFESWDNMVSLIKKKKSGLLTRSIASSLNLQEGSNLDTEIRPADTDILAQLVKNEKPYDFINEDDFGLRYLLANTLTRLFRKDPKSFEKLLIDEIQLHKKYLNMYFRELPFASHRKWMSFADWSQDGIAFIKSCLIELPNIDWQIQQMMLELGIDPIEIILDIFKQRSKQDKGVFGTHYEEIPYHFNHDLQQYLAVHPKYAEEMVKWLEEMTPEWSSYNWHITHFIQRIGGISFQSILMKLIENSSEDNLKRATYVLRAFDNVDLSLCMEIVKRTDNEVILSEIYGAISTTGVVSGENGIGLAYKAKATQFAQFITSEDKRVREFAINMKNTFEQMSDNESKRSAERTRIRKIEFEAN